MPKSLQGSVTAPVPSCPGSFKESLGVRRRILNEDHLKGTYNEKDPVPQDVNMKRGVANKHKDRLLPQSYLTKDCLENPWVSGGGSFDRNVQ